MEEKGEYKRIVSLSDYIYGNGKIMTKLPLPIAELMEDGYAADIVDKNAKE